MANLMHGYYYKLGGVNGKIPIVCESFEEWGEWYETANRQVKLTTVGEFYISTVFLSLAYLPHRGGNMRLFETMAFPDVDDDYFPIHYSTWEDAEKGHKKAVLFVKKKIQESL